MTIKQSTVGSLGLLAFAFGALALTACGDTNASRDTGEGGSAGSGNGGAGDAATGGSKSGGTSGTKTGGTGGSKSGGTSGTETGGTGGTATGGTGGKATGGTGGTATGGTGGAATGGTGGTVDNYVPTLTDANSVAVDLSKCTFFRAMWEPDNTRIGMIGLNATATCTIDVPKAGSQIVVAVNGDDAEGENGKFKLTVDNVAVGTETTVTVDKADYPFNTTVATGSRSIVVTFTNDLYFPGVYDRNIRVFSIRVKQ